MDAKRSVKKLVGVGGIPEAAGLKEKGFDGQHSSSCYARRPAATAAPI